MQGCAAGPRAGWLRRAGAVALALALGGAAAARADAGLEALAEGFLREAAALEARLAEAPQDFEAQLGAAAALNLAMAARTRGNLPLVDGLQDTQEHRAVWAELGPRALEHARRAHAQRPDSVEAAAALATAYMFYASSLGIVRSILGGAAGEYREHASRVIDLDPAYDDAMGHTLLAGFYLVAPWPVGDSDEALGHYARAAELAPGSVRNQYGLAVYWARQGDAERARRHFERVREQPCSDGSERLLCDWMKREAQRVLAEQ